MVKSHRALVRVALVELPKQASVKILATGGIGGVHRGAETSFDISSDITELARTPVCVVSAGIKSILDVPKTLEQLETHAVPVASLGTDRFPGFFTSDSGCDSPLKLRDEVHASSVASQALSLGTGGMIIGVPIPETQEAEGKQIEHALQSALAEAQQHGISGPEVTPYLLRRIRELTGGESRRANALLAENNAAAAAAIARNMSKNEAMAR